jgi:hypothetical protein
MINRDSYNINQNEEEGSDLSDEDLSFGDENKDQNNNKKFKNESSSLVYNDVNGNFYFNS